MTRREAVRRIVPLLDDVPSVMEVTAILAQRCESHGHEDPRRTGKCAWCGEDINDGE